MGWLFNWRLWAVGFVAFCLITAPHSSAGMVHKGTGALRYAADSLRLFVTDL